MHMHMLLLLFLMNHLKIVVMAKVWIKPFLICMKIWSLMNSLALFLWLSDKCWIVNCVARYLQKKDDFKLVNGMNTQQQIISWVSQYVLTQNWHILWPGKHCLWSSHWRYWSYGAWNILDTSVPVTTWFGSCISAFGLKQGLLEKSHAWCKLWFPLCSCD